MPNTLLCISHAARHPEERNKTMNSLSLSAPSIIIVDRIKMAFDPLSKTVVIDQAAPDVDFGWKIIPCRISYSTLINLLNQDYSDMENVDWL